jgi:hypothetical protein
MYSSDTVELPGGNSWTGIESLATLRRSVRSIANAIVTEYIKEKPMLKHSSHSSFLSAGILLCALAASPFASAGCGCPSDGHGKSKPVGSGLGESFPMSADLAADPAWQVYEFERDGIRYVQVNDKAGRVRAAVGYIDDTFWVLPIGSDADRVSIGSQPLVAGKGVKPLMRSTRSKSIYRSNVLEVVLYRNGNQDRWVIGLSGSAR